MAKAYYSCPQCAGDVLVLAGSGKEATSRAEFLQKRGDLCDECKKKELANEQAIKAAAATDANRAAGLPTLTGSAKQIAWAEQIRAKTIPMLEYILIALDFLEKEKAAGGQEAEEWRSKATKWEHSLPNDYQLINHKAWVCAQMGLNSKSFSVLLELVRNESNSDWWISNKNTSVEMLCLKLKDEIGFQPKEESPLRPRLRPHPRTK